MRVGKKVTKPKETGEVKDGFVNELRAHGKITYQISDHRV